MDERKAAIQLFDIVRYKNSDYYRRNDKNNPELIALMEQLVVEYDIKFEETFLSKLEVRPC